MPFFKCEADLPPVFLPPLPQTVRAVVAGALPLSGQTLLLVEDSRVTSDVMRLMCQRLGARLRRAETLRAAQEHLKVYRPDGVIIDLGLPDGRGETLIRELALSKPRPKVILGTSGDASGRMAALAAGANGFLEKPIESLAMFQSTILHHLLGPTEADLVTSRTVISPDPLAMHDDLLHAVDLLATADPDPAQSRYLSGFVSGLALVAHDAAMGEAAHHIEDPCGRARLAALLSAKLAEEREPLFAPPAGG